MIDPALTHVESAELSAVSTTVGGHVAGGAPTLLGNGRSRHRKVVGDGERGAVRRPRDCRDPPDGVCCGERARRQVARIPQHDRPDRTVASLRAADDP